MIAARVVEVPVSAVPAEAILPLEEVIAGIDVRSAETVTVEGGVYRLIPVGFLLTTSCVYGSVTTHPPLTSIRFHRCPMAGSWIELPTRLAHTDSLMVPRLPTVTPQQGIATGLAHRPSS